jgi:hypothetical protein
MLGQEALEAPVPGSLLVLMSRLMRAQPDRATEDTDLVEG